MNKITNPTSTWRAVLQSGLQPKSVAKFVKDGATFLLNNIDKNYDLTLVVLRGGILLEGCLQSYGHKTQRIWAKKGQINSFPNISSSLTRILIADVLSDTGNTLRNCADGIIEMFPSCQIDFFCVYTTENSLHVLKSFHHFYYLEVLGSNHNAMAKHCWEIPYDFGDIAENLTGKLYEQEET